MHLAFFPSSSLGWIENNNPLTSNSSKTIWLITAWRPGWCFSTACRGWLHRATGGVLIKRIREKESSLQGKDLGRLLQYPLSLPFLLPFVSSSNSSTSSLPPPSCLVLSAALLPTLLCNLIHLVMAPDQYPFSLALGRASWICLFQTVVVLASRGSRGPASWYRCTTQQYLENKARLASHLSLASHFNLCFVPQPTLLPRFPSWLLWTILFLRDDEMQRLVG